MNVLAPADKESGAGCDPISRYDDCATYKREDSGSKGTLHYQTPLRVPPQNVTIQSSFLSFSSEFVSCPLVLYYSVATYMDGWKQTGKWRGIAIATEEKQKGLFSKTKKIFFQLFWEGVSKVFIFDIFMFYKLIGAAFVD